MKLERNSIEYGRLSIKYVVVRRKRRTLEIAVEPDLTVSIAAPLTASPESIAAKVRKRAPWILAQQRYFEQFQPRTPDRRYLPGETHLYLGRQHRLKVVKGESGSVKLLRGVFMIQSTQPDSPAVTKTLLSNWYAEKARMKFLERIDVCLKGFPPQAKARPAGLTVRSMPKKWGAMSKRGRLSLNMRLIQAPLDAIDYVITHELCHLRILDHSPRYFRLLSSVMPDWERRKERLERLLA